MQRVPKCYTRSFEIADEIIAVERRFRSIDFLLRTRGATSRFFVCILMGGGLETLLSFVGQHLCSRSCVFIVCSNAKREYDVRRQPCGTIETSTRMNSRYTIIIDATQRGAIFRLKCPGIFCFNGFFPPEDRFATLSASRSVLHNFVEESRFIQTFRNLHASVCTLRECEIGWLAHVYARN